MSFQVEGFGGLRVQRFRFRLKALVFRSVEGGGVRVAHGDNIVKKEALQGRA